MAYDLEEQEQLDNIKAWWKQNGSVLVITVIVALTAYVAWISWTSYQDKQAVKASNIFEEIQLSVSKNEISKIQTLTETLIKDFPSTSYASMASFLAAKSSFDANELKAAKKHLNWVVEKSNNVAYKDIARLRLSSIALDEKLYDEGLKHLSAEFSIEFQGEAADYKGDILYAQNKLNEAKTSYQLALLKLSDKHPGKQLVKIKLDSLGGEDDQKDAVNESKK